LEDLIKKKNNLIKKIKIKEWEKKLKK
jgi:hypothetical protein